jgi:cytochrome P450
MVEKKSHMVQRGASETIEVRQPPTPTSPSAVQALRWIGRPYEFLSECAATFGDVFALDLGAEKYVVFSRPEHLRQIFTADASVLHVGPGNAVLEPIVGPSSLLLLEEQRHLRERRLLLPAFHQKTVMQYGHTIRDALLAATASWSTGSKFVAHHLLQDVSIDVILRAVFGLRGGQTCADLKTALLELLNDKQLGLGLLGRLREGAPHPVLTVFRQRLDKVGAVTNAAIEERIGSPDQGDGDLLSLLIATTDEKGNPRPRNEIRDELLTLVVTGHETTATAMAWGLYWIATHERVAKRLRAELETIGPAPDPKAFMKLEYLDATCKEILRIYPIVPSVFRQVVQPFRLDDYEFEPGTVISPSIYLTHQRSELFPEPQSFEPERFLQRSFTPYEYLPFGGGARRCIGMQLAVYEMKVILATLFSKYDLEVVSGQNVVPTRRMVTIAPSTGPRMLVKGVLA